MGGIFSLAVLISGRGSNLRSLIDKGENYAVIHVFSDSPGAEGLIYAQERGIKTTSLNRSDYDSKEQHLTALLKEVDAFQFDLICLAGFMRIVPPSFIDKHKNKIINIHPSLLPDLPGLKTHERALSEKRSEHGCTVHFVDHGIDTGARIAQAKVPILDSDTIETLASRVLQREHELYPWVVNLIAKGDIALKNGKLEYSNRAQSEASKNGFILPGIEL